MYLLTVILPLTLADGIHAGVKGTMVSDMTGGATSEARDAVLNGSSTQYVGVQILHHGFCEAEVLLVCLAVQKLDELNNIWRPTHHRPKLCAAVMSKSSNCTNPTLKSLCSKRQPWGESMS